MTKASRPRFDLGAVVVLCLGSIAAAQPGPFTIRRGAVGPIAIGLSGEAIDAMFPADRRRLIDLQLEGMPSPALALTLPNSTYRDGVIAELRQRADRNEVWRIWVKDPTVRTAKGIGVGSTVSALRAAYRIRWVGAGEGHVYLYVGELAASFELEEPSGPHEPLAFIKDPNKVPAGIRIIGVLLTEAR